MTQPYTPYRDMPGEEYKSPNYTARTLLWILVSLLLAFLGGWFLLDAHAAEDILRLVVQSLIITIGAVLPFSLYAYFAQTSHAVIWSEFEQNLQRLGMVPSRYRERFESVYGGGESRSGRAAELPAYLATAILFVGWWLVFFPRDGTDNTLPFVTPYSSVLTFGFLGAYAQSLLTLVRRFVTGDLKPKAFAGVIERVLLATIVVWVIGKIGAWEGGWLLVLSFFFGMYPYVALLFIESAVSVITGLRTGFRDRYPLSRVQGLTRLDRERLKDENIDNVQHLATADIVDLLLKTPYPQERVVDWIDQAILQFHLYPREEKDEQRPLVVQEAGANAAATALENPSVSGAVKEAATLDTDAVDAAQDLSALGRQIGAGAMALQGLDVADPMCPFIVTGIRNATDLLFVYDQLSADRHQPLKDLLRQANPGLELDYLIAALRQDPNIIHIRHWRENEHLAIAEMPERMVSRADALMAQAEEIQQAGNEDRAQALYDKAARLYKEAEQAFYAAPARIAAMLGHGRALLRQGKPEAAIKDFDAAAKADETGELGGLEARLERARLYRDAQQEGGIEFESAGDPLEDIQLLLKRPAYRTAEVWRLYYDLHQGTIDMRTMRESLTEAIRIATDPQEKAGLLRLRAPHLSPVDREADYRAALELLPWDPASLQSMIDFYVEQGNYAAAVSWLEKWIEHLQQADVNERSRWIGLAYEKLGFVHQRLEQYEAAAAAFEASTDMPFDLTSGFQGAAMGLAVECYERAGAYDRMVALYDRRGELLSAAQTLRRIGDLEGARKRLEKVAGQLVLRKRGLDIDNLGRALPPMSAEPDYFFELALVDACGGASDRATENPIAAVRLKRERSEQTELMSRIDGELVACENAQAWGEASIAAWNEIDAVLREADLLWSRDQVHEFVQLLQSALDQLSAEDLTEPWEVLKSSLYRDRLQWPEGINFYLLNFIRAVEQLDEQTVKVHPHRSKSDDMDTLGEFPSYVRKWFVYEDEELGATIGDFSRDEDGNWTITLSPIDVEERESRGFSSDYSPAAHLAEILASFV